VAGGARGGVAYWWGQLFMRQGLVREKELEAAMHSVLKPFFRDVRSERRSFFHLRHIDARPDINAARDFLVSRIAAVLDQHV
jgi:hypothetical protein